ncbi:MAG: hypothetical protein NVS1B12_10760 [Acidimicrobiales bacterium]
MDRRAFLALMGAGAVAACSQANPPQGELVLIPNDWEFLSGSDYRLSVLIASSAHNGAPLPLTAPVTLRVGPEKGALGPELKTVIHTQGSAPNYALTSHRFDAPGTYNIEATYRTRRVMLPVQVIEPSASSTPVVGAKMIRTPTPTVTAPLGVNPVCTAQPPCPFHAVSLDAALDAHKPIALLFATPALCQSRFCGPVLDNLVAVHQAYADRVTFIHCEIYTDLTGQKGVAAVDKFGLQHEPMLYMADESGVIKVRIDNLFDRAEARDALRTAFGP